MTMICSIARCLTNEMKAYDPEKEQKDGFRQKVALNKTETEQRLLEEYERDKRGDKMRREEEARKKKDEERIMRIEKEEIEKKMQQEKERREREERARLKWLEEKDIETKRHAEEEAKYVRVI